MNKIQYATEWAQALVLALVMSIVFFTIFVWGGISLYTDDNARMFLFMVSVVIGFVAVYFAIFKLKKSWSLGIGGL